MVLLQSKGLMLIASVALATAVASLAMNVYVITAPDPQDGDDDLESRVTDLENRVADLESRMDDLESRMDDVESRLSSLESRMDALEQRVSDLENGTTGLTEPVVALGPADAIGQNIWQVDVVGISEVTELSGWEVVLLINETVVETMSPLAPGTLGNITFVDLVGEGNLTVGDYFTITSVSSSHYEIVLAWRETHNARGSEDWYTP